MVLLGLFHYVSPKSTHQTHSYQSICERLSPPFHSSPTPPYHRHHPPGKNTKEKRKFKHDQDHNWKCGTIWEITSLQWCIDTLCGVPVTETNHFTSLQTANGKGTSNVPSLPRSSSQFGSDPLPTIPPSLLPRSPYLGLYFHDRVLIAIDSATGTRNDLVPNKLAWLLAGIIQ